MSERVYYKRVINEVLMSDFDKLKANFVHRLKDEFGISDELADKIGALPLRVDEDPEVNRRRAEWMAFCVKAGSL